MASVDWNYLQENVSGTVILPSDSDFGSELDGLVWNALKPDRSPAAIVKVADTGDVQQAILFARDNGLKVVVRGGGHNWNGAQVRDDALVIDLANLNQVHIDVERQRAIIQPVVTNAEVVESLGQVGLGFPVGDCPSVSASGYLLGGGLGLNTPSWGPGCMNVESVHMVNAKGEALVANAKHNTELFWSARGGAQGFPGVVTRYHLKVHPLPKAIHQATFVYKLEDSQEFADWLAEIVLDLPPKIYSNTLVTATLGAKLEMDILNRLPHALQRIARHLLGGGRNEDGDRKAWFTYVAAAFADTDDEARELLAPFKDAPPGPKPLFHLPCTPSSFKLLNDFTGLLFPYGRYFLADYHWMGDSMPYNEIIRKMGPEYVKTLDADSFMLVVCYQTPPAAMMPEGSASFSMSSHNLVGVYAIADQKRDIPQNQQWSSTMRDMLGPDSVGLYVGEADLEAFPGRAARCYSKEAWVKLREIKKKYDPDNLFAWFLGDESPSANGC